MDQLEHPHESWASARGQLPAHDFLVREVHDRSSENALRVLTPGIDHECSAYLACAPRLVYMSTQV